MGCRESRFESSSSQSETSDSDDKPIRIEIMFAGNPRSPGKASSGSNAINGGRTMKDYEDQLGALQKENFNLKLRVYFLEEKMGISSADENSVKSNIELKVEIESLRKELLEKQELLSQAAKAFQLHEEQKEAAARNQAQYQQLLDDQHQRIAQLEHELEDLKEKTTDPSLYYETTFGITPELAIENKEKLQQMQEFIESLEAEVRQLTSSLEEERLWGQEIENERNQLKKRLDNEIHTREKLTSMRDDDIELMRVRIKELEEISLKRERTSQQYKNELVEKDRLIKEKISLLEEKCRLCDDFSTIAENKQKQIENLRASIKARDDTITELNCKNRLLHNKIESNLMKRLSPPTSPRALRDDPQSSRFIGNSTNSLPMPFNWENNQERAGKISPQTQSSVVDDKILTELKMELEERDRVIKNLEDVRKQLLLKLCNVEESAELTEKELKKIKLDYEKALKSIQDLIERQNSLQEKTRRKDKKIVDLQQQLTKLRSFEILRNRSSQLSPPRRTTSKEIIDDNGERNQRFEEMEAMINELRDEIESIKVEKNELEKQIHQESQELRSEIQEKQEQIESLMNERDEMKQDLFEKDSEISRLRMDQDLFENELPQSIVAEEKERLEQELLVMSKDVEEKDKKIEQLSKELDKKTQNLQQLVNTELWSKNKEIAKLHNHMTANQSQSINSQLDILLNELHDIGVNVKFTDENVELNYVDNKKESTNIKTLDNYIQGLLKQKSELEKEVEYLKWFKMISRSETENEINCEDFKIEKNKEYCELLRTHMKDLMKFMKEMLKTSNYTSTNEYKKIILELLVGSQILSEDFVNALGDVRSKQLTIDDLCTCKNVQKINNKFTICDDDRPGCSVQSDSEAFSEPDRIVSLARIGLQDLQQKSLNRPRFSKYMKTFSDSEDSLDYIPYHKTFQNDAIEIDARHQIQELKETNNLLYTELNELRNELSIKTSNENLINDKLIPLMTKLEKSQDFCQKLQSSFDKKLDDNSSLFLKKDKQNNSRKLHVDKNIYYVENCKESKEEKTNEIIASLNNENELLKKRIKKIENDKLIEKETISTLTRELDRLTLSHSQVLVENTKLTSEKSRLEQQIRKFESKYDSTIREIREKFNKEINDLNQVIDSQRVRVCEVENTNKELRRQVVVCETSDSAPSSSGISSIPAEILNTKQTCDDVLQDYHYRGSQYWMPINYQSSNGRSKSSCSPDLGIESDAAVSTTRPLKDTLKITESMTNLLSDEDNCNNNNPTSQDLDRESPLHLEGGLYYSLDEMEALKQENQTLKKRLMKTRRALEDTFEHLSASNKNKKNVEKAITKQLMITKSILKKTRTCEEPFNNS